MNVTPAICLVTDRRRIAPSADDQAASDRVVEQVSAAADAGVDLIQLRERDLEGRALAALVGRCLDRVRGRAPLIVNERLDVAIAAGADGVHLPESAIASQAARRIAPGGFLVGRSVHDPKEAARGDLTQGLDYLVFGTVFPTASKPGATAAGGARRLAEACAATRLPVFAIGGITLQNAGDVIRAGAAGIAAIGLFVPPAGVSLESHLASVVAGLRRMFDTCGTLS